MTLPTVCSSYMPILEMTESDWLPGAMELSTGPLQRRSICRIRTQSFMGAAVSQTQRETVDRASWCLVSIASVPGLGHQMNEQKRRLAFFKHVLWPSATRPAQEMCSPVPCHTGPSPSPSTTQRGTGFMSDLLVHMQGFTQDQQPGHSPPATPPMDGLEGGLCGTSGSG